MAKKSGRNSIKLDNSMTYLVEGTYPEETVTNTVSELVRQYSNGNRDYREAALRNIADSCLKQGLRSREDAAKDKREYSRRDALYSMLPEGIAANRRNHIGRPQSGRRSFDSRSDGRGGSSYMVHSGREEFYALMFYKALEDKKGTDNIRKMLERAGQKEVGAYFKGDFNTVNPIPLMILLMLNERKIAGNFAELLHQVMTKRKRENPAYTGPVQNLAEIALYANPKKATQYFNWIKKEIGSEVIESPAYFRKRREKLEEKLTEILKNAIKALGN